MKWKILPAVAVFALAAAAGCRGGHERGKPAAPSTVTAELATAELVTATDEIELSGTVVAERVSEVSSRVMALVTAVRAEVGDTVAKGQVLVEIGPQTSAGQLGQAQGGLAQAQANLALAERNYERFKNLAASEAASQMELDMARAQYEAAKGAVEQAKGAVAAASSVAAESRVVAPFAGRVAGRMVEAGDLAAPGRPLLRVESAAGRRLAVAVPEGVMAGRGWKRGDPVDVSIDARPDLGRMTGRIVEIAPGPDPLTHAVGVEIALAAADVGTGSFGRAYLPGLPGTQRETVVVPAGAVLRQGGAALVVVRGEDGAALSRAVTVGEARPDGRVEILTGLSGGETVLVGLAAPPPLGAKVAEGGAP
jgi:RND family efflux transporter MFP subunit